MAMAQNHTPGVTITGDPDADFRMETHVNKTFGSTDKGDPKLVSISVVNGAYPKHALVFDASGGHVRVTGEGSVPYRLHLELCNKLSETLNNL